MHQQTRVCTRCESASRPVVLPVKQTQGCIQRLCVGEHLHLLCAYWKNKLQFCDAQMADRESSTQTLFLLIFFFPLFSGTKSSGFSLDPQEKDI